MLLSDCSCGTAKKATSDRTETQHSGNEKVAIGVELVLVAEMCRLVLVVIRCAEDRVLRTFARHLFWLPWQSWLSLQASSLVGVGFPSPARLAVSFLVITVCVVDTPNLQSSDPLVQRRHDCSDSFHISGINDVTPSDFDTRNPLLDLSRRLSLQAVTLSANQRGSPFLGFWTCDFCLFAPSPEATALHHRCFGSSQGLFSGRSPCTHCCRSKL